MTPIALSIAGSDPCGGAGIQADLRVFSAQGVYGCTVITALTAQHHQKVIATQSIPAAFVGQQLATLLHNLPVKAIKTGMLWSEEIILEIDRVLDIYPHIPLVIDPVLISSSGTPLMSKTALECLKSTLIPRCCLLTPNLDEAAALMGTSYSSTSISIKEMYEHLGCGILLKGGHRTGPPIDIFYNGTKEISFHHPRIEGRCTHGTGCLLSAAITAQLALGSPLIQAIEMGIAILRTALAHPLLLREDLAITGIEQTKENILLHKQLHEIQRKE